MRFQLPGAAGDLIATADPFPEDRPRTPPFRTNMPHCKLLLLPCISLFLLSACGQDLKLKRLEAELESAKNQGELNVKSHELRCHLEGKLKSLEERFEKGLEGTELELFQKSTAAWRAYLDLEVAFEASWYEGGTIQPLMANTAATRLIEERLKALNERSPQGGK